MKACYLKLRQLVDAGAIFVGHGLKTDFEIINMVIPPDQVSSKQPSRTHAHPDNSLSLSLSAHTHTHTHTHTFLTHPLLPLLLSGGRHGPPLLDPRLAPPLAPLPRVAPPRRADGQPHGRPARLDRGRADGARPSTRSTLSCRRRARSTTRSTTSTTSAGYELGGAVARAPNTSLSLRR